MTSSLRKGAACAVLLALLAACSRSGAPPVIPGTLRIALPIAPNSLNTLLSQNTSETFMASLLYSTLVTVDAHGRDVPDLATVVPTLANGGISKDGRTITYHLRRNAYWDDGVPVTSRDVLFTYRAIMNPRNDAGDRSGYDQIASMTAPDPYTVVVRMKRLYAPAIDTIFGESDSPYRILPAHLLARYASINHVPFNSAPVGSGPYRFVSWRRGDSIILAANPRYYLGKPKIARIIVKLIDDGNTTEAELRAHDVDLAFDITETNYNDLANVPGIVRVTAPAPSYTAIVFNMSHPPLDDLRVRRALALAIDRAAIVHDDTFGTGTLAVADLSRFYWAYDDKLSPLPYDPAESDRLLDAAGWKLTPSGVRVKNGHRLELQLIYGLGSELAQNIVTQVQQMLSGVGVDVTLKGYDYPQLYADVQDGGILDNGKFDLGMWSWIAGADPDDSTLWMSTTIPPNGSNVERYRSAAMDAAQRLALSTFDRSVRKRAYARIESLLLRDVPAAFIYYAGERFAYTSALTGLAPNGTNSEGWNVYQWNI